MHHRQTEKIGTSANDVVEVPKGKTKAKGTKEDKKQKHIEGQHCWKWNAEWGPAAQSVELHVH